MANQPDTNAAALPKCVDIRRLAADMTRKQRGDALLKFWPNGDHGRGARTSGINCLLVLLKGLYHSMTSSMFWFGDYSINAVGSWFPGDFWDANIESNKNNEQTNAFMEHAWLVHNGSKYDVGASLIDLVEKVWNKPLDQIPQEELAFEHIISSQTMMDTLWSLTQLNPLSEPLWARLYTDEWRKSDHPDTPTEVAICMNHLFPPRPAWFRFDAFPGMCLNTQVNEYLGYFFLDETKALIRPDTPGIFGVTFFVKDVGEQKLDFDQFRRIDLQVAEFVEVNGYKQWRRTTGSKHYDLMALVKSRNGPEDHDTIRLYQKCGHHCEPAEELPAYASPGWTMADMKNGDSFVAVYASCGRPRYALWPPSEVEVKMTSSPGDWSEAEVEFDMQ